MGSMLLRTTATLLGGMLAVLSVYALLRAHYAPGGGFAGGLILAAAVAVQLLAHGVARARRALRIDPRTLIGLGLLTSAAATWLGPVLGRPLLAPVMGPDIPALAHVSSPLLFDVGVYLLVAGAAVTIMFVLVEDR